MSRHRKEITYSTTKERLVKGIGGGLLAIGGFVGGFALAGEGIGRIAHEQFDAPEVARPFQKAVDTMTPDFVYEPLESALNPTAFGAMEVGLAIGGLALIYGGMTPVQRALRPPEPPAAQHNNEQA